LGQLAGVQAQAWLSHAAEPQLEQKAPPLPHDDELVPGLQAPVARSKHPLHFEQTPAEHSSLVAQPLQATPLAPHWLGEVAVTQVPLSQHPWQFVQLAVLPPPVPAMPPPVAVVPPPVAVVPPPNEFEPPPAPETSVHWPIKHSSAPLQR
jgi:hypothetical protein